MRKGRLLALFGAGLIVLSGCGGSSSSGSSTVVSGSISGASGATSGITVRAQHSDDSFSESDEPSSSGNFSFSRVPEGLVEVELTRDGEDNKIEFDVEVEDGETNEVELFVLTWTPEAIAELRTRVGENSSFGSVRPLGPTGTNMSTNTDGDRTYETAKGLKVTRKADDSVEVDDTGYTP